MGVFYLAERMFFYRSDTLPASDTLAVSLPTGRERNFFPIRWYARIATAASDTQIAENGDIRQIFPRRRKKYPSIPSDWKKNPLSACTQSVAHKVHAILFLSTAKNTRFEYKYSFSSKKIVCPYSVTQNRKKHHYLVGKYSPTSAAPS